MYLRPNVHVHVYMTYVSICFFTVNINLYNIYYVIFEQNIFVFWVLKKTHSVLHFYQSVWPISDYFCVSFQFLSLLRFFSHPCRAQQVVILIVRRSFKFFLLLMLFHYSPSESFFGFNFFLKFTDENKAKIYIFLNIFMFLNIEKSINLIIAAAFSYHCI